ncbi:UNVERIFIED_ORG: EmrB/QacA subfamily drug resistance transporter [Gordonia westfalica J30]
MFEKYSPARARSQLVLAAVATTQFLVSLDLSVVNVGLPRISDALGFDGVGVTWVIHSYALTFGGLLLLGGKLADRYGHRRLLLTGLVIFGLASLAGGLATSAGMLVGARALQGVGAAAMAPAALALLAMTFPTGRERVKAFGIWSATNAAGGAFGVVLGGLLTEYAGWRWVLLVNIPIAALAWVLAARAMPAREAAHTDRGSPDVLGAVLVTAGMTTLVFAVVRTDAVGWGSPATVVTLVAAAVLLAGFLVVERTTPREPLLRLGIFANRRVAGANAFNLLLGGAIASAFYFASLYAQRILGAGPALAGVEFLPFALGVILGSVLAIRLGYRYAPRTLMIVGGLLTAFGLAWFGMISVGGSFLTDILGPSIATGTGFGLALAPVVSTATADVAPDETGTASALLTSSRQIGAALGLAALGTLAAHRTGDDADLDATNAGYAVGFTGAAALLFVAVLIAVVVLPSRTRPTETADTAPAGARQRGVTMQSLTHTRPAVIALYLGAALTVLATVVPFAATDVLRDHIAHGYPDYPAADLDAAVTAYLVVLGTIGGLGLLGWLVSARAVRRGRTYARWLSAGLFAAALLVAVTLIFIKDTSGEVGLAPAVGWLQVLPCIAGLVAVLTIWRRKESPMRAA